MKHIFSVLVLASCLGCNAVASSPTPQDDALRAAAAVKVVMTSAYTVTADLLQAGALPFDSAKAIYINLNQAEAALALAQANLVTNPTSASAYIATALQITTQVWADLDKIKPPAVVAPKVITDGSGGAK